MGALRYMGGIATALKPGDKICFRIAERAHTACFVRSGIDLEVPRRGGGYIHQLDLWAWHDVLTEDQCRNIAMLIGYSHGLAIENSQPTERRGQLLIFELVE